MCVKTIQKTVNIFRGTNQKLVKNGQIMKKIKLKKKKRKSKGNSFRYSNLVVKNINIFLTTLCYSIIT